MIIKLKNGEVAQLGGAEENTQFIQGAARRTLTLHVTDARGFGELKDLLGGANLDEIEISSPESWVPPEGAPDMPAPADSYTGFSLRDSFGYKTVIVSAETSTAPAVYEERLVCVIAEISYLERLLRDLGLR